MSTKVPEKCPECQKSNMPTDTVIVVRGLPLRLWRYHCEDCGWTWANPLQREHNSHEHVLMIKSCGGMEPMYG